MTYGFRPENWPAFQAELQKRGISAPDIEKVEMRPTDRDRLGRVKRRLSSIALQKPVDDGPWVRFLRALGWRRFRRPRRLLRLRPFFTNRFGRARWRGRDRASDLVKGVVAAATRHDADQKHESHAAYGGR